MRLTPDRNLSDIERRVANTVAFGVVEDADYERRRVRVRIGPLLSDWIPWTTGRAAQDRTWHPVEVGEQVVMIAPNGDMKQGVVVGAVNSTANPGPSDRPTLSRTVYEDGTFVQHDRETSEYTIDVNEAGQVLVRIGASRIVMTDARILLESNGSTLEMDAAGIRLNAIRIDLN